MQLWCWFLAFFFGERQIGHPISDLSFVQIHLDDLRR